MLIAHVSDSHISLGGPADSERLAVLDACTAAINELDPQPDLVVHTGDVVHNGTTEEYGQAAGILKRLTAPLRVIPGNKDTRSGLRQAFPDNCGPSECADFMQFSEDFDGIRCLFLDTKSETGSKGIMCSERIEHFRGIAVPSGPSTVVFMHHPPFDVWTAPEPFQFEDRANADRVFSILEEGKTMAMLVAGHIHRPWLEKRGEMELRAVTALARDLRKGQELAEIANDGFFMLYDVGPDGGVRSRLRRVSMSD